MLECRYGAKLRGVRERIEFRVDHKHVAALLGSALESGAGVVSLSPHRPSLESVFLTAMRDAAEADQGDADERGASS